MASLLKKAIFIHPPHLIGTDDGIYQAFENNELEDGMGSRGIDRGGW